MTRRGFLRLSAGVAGAAVAAPRLRAAEAGLGAPVATPSVVSLVRGERPPEERGRGAGPRRGPDPAGPPAEEVRRHQAERGLPDPAPRHHERRRPPRDPRLPRAPLQGPGGHRRVLGGRHLRRLRALRLHEGPGRAQGPRGDPRRPQRRGPLRDPADPRRQPAPPARAPRRAPPRPRRLRHLRRGAEDAQRGGGDALDQEHGARAPRCAARPRRARAGATSAATTWASGRCTTTSCSPRSGCGPSGARP